jgi:hypothetical protein
VRNPSWVPTTLRLKGGVGLGNFICHEEYSGLIPCVSFICMVQNFHIWVYSPFIGLDGCVMYRARLCQSSEYDQRSFRLRSFLLTAGSPMSGRRKAQAFKGKKWQNISQLVVPKTPATTPPDSEPPASTISQKFTHLPAAVGRHSKSSEVYVPHPNPPPAVLPLSSVPLK